MTTLAQRIARWPKAELHLHLEGSIRPATLCELAARHRQPMDAETVAALYRYHSFRGFLNAFKRVTALLRTPDDYALITQRLTEELLAQNVIYAEVIVSAGVMLRRQQDVEANFAAICEAARPAERRGLRLAWSFDAVRQFGLAHIWRVARLAVQLGSQGVVAFGVGGDETALPTRSLQPVYEFVAAHGLHRLIHAGEIGPPSAVREAVEVLGCERIGHGIAALRHKQPRRFRPAGFGPAGEVGGFVVSTCEPHMARHRRWTFRRRTGMALSRRGLSPRPRGHRCADRGISRS